MEMLTAAAPPTADKPTAGLPGQPPDDEQGILLYYNYVSLEGGDREDVTRFYEEMCGRLELRGRIRVARDGINVTVGGSLTSLAAHTAAVIAHPLLAGSDIDFKLAPSNGPRNETTRQQTHMDCLVVRQCEELVTLGPLARHRADPRVSTAPHLTPEQFHDLLRQAAGAGEADGAGTGAPEEKDLGHANSGDDGRADVPVSGGGVVLLDARNIYETRIGHFEAGPAVPTLDPRTRCFSELPAWMDEHEEALRDRTVLMYCTGGVRCERASAYLREKGPAFSRVFQLSGGIQRYLERFPGGGFFRGKNFLYDDRIAVGPIGKPPKETVVGCCQGCGAAWDDYGARLRCSRCRLLLLLCDTCSPPHHQQNQHTTHQTPEVSEELLCELCRVSSSAVTITAPAVCTTGRGPGDGGLMTAEHTRVDDNVEGKPGLLLPQSLPGPSLVAAVVGHASSGTVEVEVEAGIATTSGHGPLTTPSVTVLGKCATEAHSSSQQKQQTEDLERSRPSCRSEVVVGGGGGMATGRGGGATEGAGSACSLLAPSSPRRLRILCLHGFRQTGKQFQGRTCALRKKLRDIADFVFLDAPHTLPAFVKTVGSRGSGGRGGGGGDGGSGKEGASPHRADDDDEREVDCRPETAALDDTIQATVHGESVAMVVPRTGTESPEVPHAAAKNASCLPAVAKRAWLLPAELCARSAAAAEVEGGTTAGNSAVEEEEEKKEAGLRATWQAAPSYVDELQYTRQTEGWRESLAVVQRAVRELGPFDGVFGFSQGASVAAVLCARQQQQQQQQLRKQHPLQQPRPATTSPTSTTPSEPVTATSINTEDTKSPTPHHADESNPEDCDFGFRFAILASGFLPANDSHRRLLSEQTPLGLPSLHVYGIGTTAASGTTASGAAATNTTTATAVGGDTPAWPSGATNRATEADHTHDGGAGVVVVVGGGCSADRQIPAAESDLLACVFGSGRRLLRHRCGHLIPATRSHAATFRSFLQQFVGGGDMEGSGVGLGTRRPER